MDQGKSSQGMEADNPSHPMVKEATAAETRHGENQMDLGNLHREWKLTSAAVPDTTSSVCLTHGTTIHYTHGITKVT